jgi:hypothetical protein
LRKEIAVRREFQKKAHAIAVNGRAVGIVSFDLSDFILSNFIDPAKKFGIEVVRPSRAVKRLEESHEKK